MNGRKEKVVRTVARLCEEEIQQARWFGWSSSSWSRVLGTLSTLMNNGEEARRRRRKKNVDGDGRRRREGGSDVHLTGGGVPPLDSSCFTALTAVALTPPPTPASFPPSSVSFSPAVVCQPQQHAPFRTHDLTESGEKGEP